MQYVDVEVLETGLIICKSRTCRYTRECANHDSAGDFRTEDGFTPRICQDQHGEWQCITIDTPATLPADGLEYPHPFPEGEYGMGALCADGTVCGFWTDAVSLARTFDEAISDARVALDEAWRLMPMSERAEVSNKLRRCFHALTYISRFAGKDSDNA